ncbi:uncharacterized protein V6R79_002799 [Siganus canaliculatus]
MFSHCPPTTAPALTLFQLNVEGLTTAKINMLEQVASKSNVTVITLQETHQENKNNLRVPGYILAVHIANKHHGIATFVRKDMAWSAAGQSPESEEIKWITTKVQDTTIVIVYKPPPSRLDMFPRSHHLPSLITIPSLVQPVPGRDVKRWNFQKANWAGFTKQLNMAAPDLPHPCPNNLNDAYDSYSNMLLDAAKNNIPHGVRKAHIPCWDEECEHLLCDHSEAQTTQGRDKAADDV